MIRRLLLTLLASLTLLSGVFVTSQVFAATTADTGLQAVGQTVKLSSADPRVIVTNIINIALGLIGIILVALILFAGFTWMTAGGDSAKVGRAQEIIRNSIIGLIIILSAWAITKFVIDKLLGAVNGDGTGGGGSAVTIGGGGCIGCDSGTAQSFRIVSMSPSGAVGIRNIEVKIVLSKPVNETTASALTVLQNGTDPVNGTVSVDGSVLKFTPATPCPAPADAKKCFSSDADFTIKLATSLKSQSGQSLTCGGFAPNCTGTFHSGSLVDMQPPSVAVSYPTDGMSLPLSTVQDVIVQASDDSGVAAVSVYDNADRIGTDGPTASSTPKSFIAHVPASFTTLGRHALAADAADVDTNTSRSSDVNVVVRADHCFNGVQDAGNGETGIDCGGDANSADYCGACMGGSCQKNADCSSGFCQSGVCVEHPVIKSVTPGDGKPGTFVTVNGSNFGSSQGVVVFLGDPANPADDKVAQIPAACAAAGGSGWSNTQAVVAVPDGASTGPIQLKNVQSGLSDQTDDTLGPPIPDFDVNGASHPGICAINPSSGHVNEETDVIGSDFGTAPAEVKFGSATLSNFTASWWSASKVHMKIPVVDAGQYDVRVRVNNVESNAVAYTVTNRSVGAAPSLDSVDPASGPLQEYVTLLGRNFGYDIGSVIFTSDVSKQEAFGDVSFPEQCAKGFWRDTSIVVKVPSVFQTRDGVVPGSYHVRVKRISDLAESNSLPFTITSGDPKPGICAMVPPVGPVGTTVTLYGDRFGTSKPTVTFHSQAVADVSSYQQTSVQATVPKSAVTGPVYLQTTSASNRVNFEVRNCNEQPDICGSPKDFKCCGNGQCRLIGDTCPAAVTSDRAEFAWSASTGLIPVAPTVIEECRPDVANAPTPSPSPWDGRAGGDSVSVDADVTVRFSRHLDPVSVSKQGAFEIAKCTGTGSDVCATASNVTGDFKSPMLSPENDFQDVVLLSHASGKVFDVSSTYRVRVASSIRASGVGGATMVVRTDCGKGPNGETYGYCFTFKTRATPDRANVGSVLVKPSAFLLTDLATPVPYEALPTSGSDACIVLNCSGYNWKWYSGTVAQADPRANVPTPGVDADHDGRVDCRQLVTGVRETGERPVDVNAQLQESQLPPSTGKLSIQFVPPRVEAKAPDCQESCSNALIWVRFTQRMRSSTVLDQSNIVVQKCVNENCYEYDGQPMKLAGMELTSPPGMPDRVDQYLSISHDNFEPGAYYHILLKAGPKQPNGIRGANGMPLTGLNDPDGFAWIFRVKPGDAAFCSPDRIDVSPESKFETNVDGRQLFTQTAFSPADTCSADGQALVQSQDAVWEIKDTTVAKFFSIAGGLLKSPAPLPAGCTFSCLASGSTGLVGKVAVCGNGKIETTDTSYCVNGKTPHGDACVVMPAGAAAGEECEPSIDGLDVCDPNTCLFKGVKGVTQGGTCGDGVVQAASGEACDFGPTCVGGSQTKTAQPIPENTPCGTLPLQQACAAAGGTCALHTYRGCSASCRHIGSIAGGSTCGNHDTKGDGKDCDDGNTNNGDGCSSVCLHEGSAPSSVVASVCGNGVLEPGETCESVNGVFPKGCDHTTCLHTGTQSCSGPGDTANCCGNGSIGLGEDCDDDNQVNGDGCSASCLFEGSSAYYLSGGKARTPSFCGNGILETGEQCDAGISSDALATRIAYPGLQGAPISGASVQSAYAALSPASQKGGKFLNTTQLVYINDAQVKPDDATGVASTTVSVTSYSKTGNASYGLQCGFTDEASCGAGFGLDDHGCCRARPALSSWYPAANATNVCRNVQILFSFTTPMDSASVVSNTQLVQAVRAASCPVGSTEVQVVSNGNSHGFFAQLWRRIVAWLAPQSAIAEIWCTGVVTGRVVPMTEGPFATNFGFVLDRALDPNTVYQIRMKGDPDLSDNGTAANRVGIKTQNGVVVAETNGSAFGWNFVSGSDICRVNNVQVIDTTIEDPAHPNLFMNADNKPETRSFAAYAQSIVNGQSVPLSPVPEYTWSWNPWSSSDVSVVDRTDAAKAPDSTDQFTSKMKSGHAMLVATLQVTKDDPAQGASVNTTVSGFADVTVALCENPWPSIAASPFRDRYQSPSMNDCTASSCPFANLAQNAYYNFSTMYCRDAGVSHDTTDDLPRMQISQIPQTAQDAAQGILRQYLFVYGADHPELKGDGIGIRILSNPLHLSAREWYQSKGFTGNPVDILVDGYPAVKDGSTVYIVAANRPNGDSGKIYSNIYLISHNPNDTKITETIYGQMVQNFVMNINANFTAQSNTCRDQNNAVVRAPGSQSAISCSSDIDCAAYTSGNTVAHCDSVKLKLTRDTVRLSDFMRMSRMFESAKAATDGRYPMLTSGTFVKGLSTSLWSSWKKELTQVGSLPIDPVNAFLTCGRCSSTGAPCSNAAACPDQNGTAQTCQGGRVENGAWKTDTSIDPATCWNANAKQFVCPSISTDPAGRSHFYQFSTEANGSQYSLASEFEVPPNGVDVSNAWWAPALPTGDYRCVNPGAVGRFCGSGAGGDDSACRVCPNGNCTGVQTIGGACRKSGGNFIYENVCPSSVIGESSVCGDGVLGSTETCEIGDVNPNPPACASNPAKPTVLDGHRRQVCVACKGFADDPQNPGCIADRACGNGRIDQGEVCDDGAINGTYGHCNTTCSGYAAYCGDSKLSPGEVCDLGAPPNGKNGEYGGACSIDCKGVGPHCGDGNVDAPNEACDGNSEKTALAICTAGAVGKPCTTNADCGTGGVCGGGTMDACAGKTAAVGQCNLDATSCTRDADCRAVGTQAQKCVQTTRATQHIRTCNPPSTDASNPQCQWHGGGTGWSACQAVGLCGDGVKDPGEECDNGSDNGDTKACLSSCKLNTCGDGFVQSGVEECDNGADNGKTTCSADYGSSCLSCSALCKFSATAGGYCGDQIRNGGEQCDGNVEVKNLVNTGNGLPKDVPASVASIIDAPCLVQPCMRSTEPSLSCKQLGFDYAKNGTRPRMIAPTTPPASITNQSVGITSCGINSLSGVKWYEYQMYQECLNMTCQKQIVLNGQPVFNTNWPAVLPSSNDFWACVRDKGAKYGISVYTDINSQNANTGELIQCTAACSFGGCAKCSQEPGNGVITAKVHDAVYANQPVPNARVTLLYNGAKVDETYTDTNGAFTFSSLNANLNCGKYRIVVDMYQDNPCTNSKDDGHPTDATACAGQTWGGKTIDESANGGYQPYSSQPFSLNSFLSSGIENTDGYVFLIPRVAANETLVVTSWSGGLRAQGGSFVDDHLVLPNGYAYKRSGGSYVACTDGQNCLRDVNYSDPGDSNMDASPHAKLYCYHVGSDSESCGSFEDAPEVFRYSRKYIDSGAFDFLLNDYDCTWQDALKKNYANPLKTRVTVVTSDQTREIRPVATGARKWLYVFSQQAGSGDVTEKLTYMGTPDVKSTFGDIFGWSVGTSCN